MASDLFKFGAGLLIANPVGGNEAANPTPQLGLSLQGTSLEFSRTNKSVYGPNQFPERVAPGEAKITGKSTFARVDFKSFNQLYFGDTSATGRVKAVQNEAAIVGASVFTITVANAAQFKADGGVLRAVDGSRLVRVASSPAAGQYSVVVATGVYTFAAADANLPILITYVYTDASNGTTITIHNNPMGFAPIFELYLFDQFGADQNGLHVFQCIATKLSHNTKRDDFVQPEMDFEVFANPAGLVAELFQLG